MTHAQRHRGFTLVEALIGGAIVILMISMASLAFLSQTQGLQSQDLGRSANTHQRDALVQIESTLRQAGWGIQPWRALDFWTDACATAQPCRDNINAPDELAFVARNPMYRWLDNGEPGCSTAGGCFSGNSWPISAVDTGAPSVTITAAPPAAFERGRIVTAVCAGGRSPVMLRVRTPTVSAAAGSLVIPLVTTAAVPYNNTGGLVACHTAAGAGLFLVDRYRYLIRTFNGVPWLMLDTGIDFDADGAFPTTDNDDLIPVAKDVEDLQVSYVFPRSGTAPDNGTGDWIMGNNRTIASREEPLVSAAVPSYTAPTTSAHPGNVRAIRVSLTIRSERMDAGKPVNWTGETVPGQENRQGNLTGGRFRRYVSTTEITLRNFSAQANFIF